MKKGGGKPKASAGDGAAPNRNERRRERTRQKLLRAARELIQADGLESLALQAVTEHADVGAGTIYNYFRSREEIAEALVAETFSGFDQVMDAMGEKNVDPALVVARAVVAMTRLAGQDRVVREFMVMPGALASEPVVKTLKGARRDVRRGIATGRFNVPSAEAGSLAIFAMVRTGYDYAQAARGRGVGVRDVARTVLQALGVDPDEAAKLAKQAAAGG